MKAYIFAIMLILGSFTSFTAKADVVRDVCGKYVIISNTPSGLVHQLQVTEDDKTTFVYSLEGGANLEPNKYYCIDGAIKTRKHRDDYTIVTEYILEVWAARPMNP